MYFAVITLRSAPEEAVCILSSRETAATTHWLRSSQLIAPAQTLWQPQALCQLDQTKVLVLETVWNWARTSHPKALEQPLPIHPLRALPSSYLGPHPEPRPFSCLQHAPCLYRSQYQIHPRQQQSWKHQSVSANLGRLRRTDPNLQDLGSYQLHDFLTGR